MPKNTRIKLNKSEEFQNGISVPLIISDKVNIEGQVWLYVNRHKDTSVLLKLLFKIQSQPYITYSQTSGKGRKKISKEFGYEWIFKENGPEIKRLKRNRFYV